MFNNPLFETIIIPGKVFTWDEFIESTPPCSIAMDGIVRGGPRFNYETRHLNFDHHDCVVRDATMSTSKQTLLAIKSGVVEWCLFKKPDRVRIYINDVDQDAGLANFLLYNYREFEKGRHLVHMESFINMVDQLDITSGGMAGDFTLEELELSSWVFEPYNNARKTGFLDTASPSDLLEIMGLVFDRLRLLLEGNAQRKPLDTRHEIFYENHRYKIVREIGGNEARLELFRKGMKAFISLKSTRPNGRYNWSIGKSCRYDDFPIRRLFDVYNKLEGFTLENGWNGGTTTGGSSRLYGSKLWYKDLVPVTNAELGIV